MTLALSYTLIQLTARPYLGRKVVSGGNLRADEKLDTTGWYRTYSVVNASFYKQRSGHGRDALAGVRASTRTDASLLISYFVSDVSRN